MHLEGVLIITLLNALASNLISQSIKYLIENKGKFRFTFLKKKRSLDDDNSTIYHPNTRFTFDENHNFVDHL